MIGFPLLHDLRATVSAIFHRANLHLAGPVCLETDFSNSTASRCVVLVGPISTLHTAQWRPP